MNCCLQNTLHINLHILYFIQVKTSSKIQELSKSIKYIKSYQENMIEFLNNSILFVFYLNFKLKSDFQVNHDSMSHEQTLIT